MSKDVKEMLKELILRELIVNYDVANCDLNSTAIKRTSRKVIMLLIKAQRELDNVITSEK